ncbi:MAG TPA: NAD-dependent epimerase/dehydratase family protein [Flavitalea sp.]|nr:NAD-dependent epimerase/dehydratase family protein [Flavitalea sp.]
MRIMLTGATGYLGHTIALKAAAANHTVHALVRNPASSSVPQHSNVRLFTGELTDLNALKAAMHSCDAVIHCAAIAKMWTRERELMYKTNVEGTRNVLQAALESNIAKVVVTSTCSVLGPSAGFPVNESSPRLDSMKTDYEISKYLAEEVCRSYSRKGLHTVIVSPPAIYGPGAETASNAISNMIKQSLKSGFLFEPSPSTLCRNFAYVEDVAHGHLLAIEHGKTGETYILGGENISYRKLSETIQKASARRLRIVRIGKLVLEGAATLNQFKLAITKAESNFVPVTVAQVFQNRIFSSNKAIVQLGYSITPFETGIQETVNHLKTNL